MIPDWLSFVDVVFVGVALLFAWGGGQRGFAAQVAHILTFLIIGGVLFYVYPPIFNYLDGVFRNVEETYLMWLLLIVLAVLAYGIFVLISKLLARVLKAQMTERTDHVYGFFLGFIRGGLTALFAMILLVMLGSPKIYDTFRMKSQVGQLVCYEMVPRIQPHLNRSVLEEKTEMIRNRLLQREEAGVFDE
jgi:uncharacterized membrane protein required for colicin V production